MKRNRSINCCRAFAALCILGSSPAVAEESVLKILWDRSELVAHVKVDRVGERQTKSEALKSWFFTATAQTVFKASPKREIPEKLTIFITRKTWPGMPRKLRVPMEKGEEYILFLKELGDQREFLALRSVFRFESKRGYTTAGSWLCVQPYDSGLEVKLTTLANLDHASGKVKKPDCKKAASRHAIACTAIAHVSVTPAPQRKPAAVPLPNRGFVVDAHPKWVVTLFVKKFSLSKRPPRKPPFRSGSTFYIADPRKTFGQDNVVKIVEGRYAQIVKGRYRVTFTWYPAGRTVAYQIDDFRAVRLKEGENASH